MGDLYRVVEDVLGEAVAEMMAAQQSDNVQSHGWQPGFGNGVLAKTDYGFIHLLVHLRDDLLDARWVDAAVRNEPYHGFASDFAADRVKAGQQDGARRIIN